MTYNSTTTLNAIRKADPCTDGWTKLLKHLGKSKADDEPLPLLVVLDSNGLDDALWVLTYAMPDDKLARHLQAWIAEQVLPSFEAERPDDMRIRNQIAMLRNDSATDAERDATREAAWEAAWDAAGWAGAMAAARAAAWNAAYTAAKDAAWPAVWDAARAAQEAQLRKMIGETE